jgi:urocanate hydratase
MAVQNAIGDAIRGATWISLHNGGGVGWGEVINGGFGLLLDGTDESENRLRLMLHWDVTNGLTRRSWARNVGAMKSIQEEMEKHPLLQVTYPQLVDDAILDGLFK